MIDHQVKVGDADVSEEVTKVTAQQSIETDSDPGKITITLANRHQMYSNRFPPQKTPIEVILYNWRYRNGAKRRLAGGRSEAEYLVATGHMTDLAANHEEAVITGECDLGHLADALPKDYDKFNVTPKEALQEILSWHSDQTIALDWDPALPNERKERITYDSDWTYQDVCEDIRQLVGALYYFNEPGVLMFRHPSTTNGVYDLDPYVTNPDQTASIMGFRNVVVIIGDQSLAGEEDSEDGKETPGSEPIIGVAYDFDSIGEVGLLIAPAERAYNIKTQAQADEMAKARLNFYRMYKNALTKPVVEGIIPPLQSLVSYTPFIPISDEEIAKMNSALNARLAELQALENELAAQQDRLAKTIKVSSRVQGVVIAREVDYSIDGMPCTLTISPGMLDIDSPITDEDVSGSVWDPSDGE